MCIAGTPGKFTFLKKIKQVLLNFFLADQIRRFIIPTTILII